MGIFGGGEKYSKEAYKDSERKSELGDPRMASFMTGLNMTPELRKFFTEKALKAMQKLKELKNKSQASRSSGIK